MFLLRSCRGCTFYSKRTHGGPAGSRSRTPIGAQLNICVAEFFFSAAFLVLLGVLPSLSI